MRSYKEQTEKILELIEQKKKSQEKRKNILVTFSSLAACAVIAMLCTSLFSGDTQGTALPVNNEITTFQTMLTSKNPTNNTKTSKADKDYTQMTTTKPVSTSRRIKVTRKKTEEIVITPTKPVEKDKPVTNKYLSHYGLNENSDDVILYNGKSYVKTCSLEANSESKKTLLNNYIGKTTGSIDDEATDEVTSNVSGKVYTINGYSENFRLGLVRNDKSTGESYIYIFDDIYSLNNSVVSAGSELFNDILHIDKYLSWVNYYCGNNFKIASLNQQSILEKISEKTQKVLLDALNNASLINGDESLFDNNDKNIVLFLYMSDETTVEVYLTQEGYIFCDGLYFKAENNIISEVYYSLIEEQY